MEPNILQALIGVAVGVAGGAGAKWASKKKDSTIHKIMSPLAAIAMATGAGVVQSSGVDVQADAPGVILSGGLKGLAAVGLHAWWKTAARDRRK